ncbi:MAG: hypothetical protein H7232_15435 [Aeromicrobium sp.]|nr:hypothetical protein [Burkholderiales bacterium]
MLVILVPSLAPVVTFAGPTIGSINAIYVLIAGGIASLPGRGAEARV